MLKNIEITKKVPLVMITFALVSALVTGVIAYSKTYASMEIAAREKLKSLLDSRKSSLHLHFDNVIHQVTYQARNPLVIAALNDFNHAWDKLEVNQSQRLQQFYIDNSPHAASATQRLNSITKNHYAQLHRQYHASMLNIIETNNYYDVLLINPKGELVYSVKKERDFATNLLTGPWRHTNLALLFKKINDHRVVSDVKVADFKPFSPSNNKPASFMGTSVFDDNANYLGAIVFQLPIEPIDKIMQVTAGMGASGETYLIGGDYLMRSNSRFFEHSSILSTQVKTKASDAGLAGQTGFLITDDYRGVSVYSAFTPINFLSLSWVMLAEVDETEVLQPVYEMSQFLLISGALITAVIFTFGYLLSSDISQPIVAMTNMMNRLSKNDLAFDICVGERKDEVGKMATAMKVFKNHALEREKLKDELHNIAIKDGLTGLFTRKYAMDNLSLFLENAILASDKVVLMFIDLDNFKQINDAHGHQRGDQALCSIANHLRQCVNPQDIVARIGGDEFLIIFPNTKHLQNVSQIADKILQTLPLTQHELNTDLGLSIGLSVFPDDAQDPATLVKYADKAMYQVKHQGKNNFSYWAS